MTARTILIVDDDPLIRRLISTTLEDVSGFRLREAADGEEAVRRGREVAGDRVPRHRHAAAGRDRGLPPHPLRPRHAGDDRDAHGRRRARGERGPARRAPTSS